MNIFNILAMTVVCFCKLNREFDYDPSNQYLRKQHDLMAQNRVGKTLNSFQSYNETNTGTPGIDNRNVQQLLKNNLVGGRRLRKLQFRMFTKHHTG